MRAKEFVVNVNVPINIKLNSDGSVDIESTGNEKDPTELEDNPIMVSPLQQDIELKKAAVGKKSNIINKLTQNEMLPNTQ